MQMFEITYAYDTNRLPTLRSSLEGSKSSVEAGAEAGARAEAVVPVPDPTSFGFYGKIKEIMYQLVKAYEMNALLFMK